MIGAGVFAAYAPAARAAGAGLLVGLAVAAVVAYCNATSSAQLAAAYPRAGGTYLYGREVLGDWWGYLAGWGFMVGKTASCAAMALTFAAYAAPDGWLRPVAAAVVVVVALVNCAGVTRTALLTRVLVSLVLVSPRRRVRRLLLRRVVVRTWPAGPRPTTGSTACSRRPGCCSSRSPAMPGSPRSARRCASRRG